MDPDTTTALAQFGIAGMVGCMWLWERRAAADRERQLTEAHERLAADRLALGVLVEALRDNTRALAAIQAGQRALADLLAALGHTGRHPAKRETDGAAAPSVP